MPRCQRFSLMAKGLSRGLDHPMSSRCCRAEGSDFIPGHSLIVSRRRDEYSCGSGPLGKDARLKQPCRSRTFSAEGSMMHNYLKLYY